MIIVQKLILEGTKKSIQVYFCTHDHSFSMVLYTRYDQYHSQIGIKFSL